LTGAATGAVVGAGVGSLAGDAVGANGEDLWARISKQWDENPAQATYNAIDRVGVFGPVFEISNMMNKAGLGGVQGMLRTMSGEDALGTSRTFNQNIFDLVGGASFGLASDVANLGSRVGDWMTEEDFTPTLGDVRRAQRLVPGQSVPYLRPFISWGNQQVGTMYDWPSP
jgi:hypothetical protein